MSTPDLIRVYRGKKGFTQAQLAEKVGVTRQTIINWEKGVTWPDAHEVKTLSKLLDVDPSTLNLKPIRGNGAVEGIPFYDAVATAGMAVYADQSPVSIPTETVHPGTWFRSATAAMRVYGDSMFPKYKSGCIIALKEIIDKEEIIYGEDYVVETTEQRVLKRVMKSEKGDEFIEMNSINPQTDARGRAIYAPKDFHLSKVRRVYKVLGQILYEAGGDSIIHRDAGY